MAEGFMGRLAGYEGALDRLAVEGEAAALRAALRRNVFGTLPEAEGDLAGLVAYVLAQAAALDAQLGDALRLGRVAFAPAPDGAESGPLIAAGGARQRVLPGKDRKSVVQGTGVLVRVNRGDSPINKQKKITNIKQSE